MDTYSIKKLDLLPALGLVALLFLTTGYTISTYAAPVQNQPINATKNMELAYYHVYRAYPRYYYRPGYYYHPAPAFVPGWGYGVHCQKHCYVNRYGAVIRCVRRCY